MGLFSSAYRTGFVWLSGVWLVRFKWRSNCYNWAGLCSSGLFCLANIVYERIRRRRLLISKGLLNFIPRIGLWWFLLRAGNMAAPPTLNLLGEVRLILRVVAWSKIRIISIAFLSFFRAAYTLYIYSLSQHGKFFSSLFSCCSGKVREYLILILK